MLDKVGQQNGRPQQTNKIDSLHTGPLNYYVIIRLGVWWIQKMGIFTYYQYIEGGSVKVQKPTYVILEWSLL